MLERISVPRRPMDFEDYMDILRRNFRWVLAPAFAGLVISTVVAYLLPDTYVSTALMRIVPQQIPESFVQNASSQQIADHINAMAENILSRNTLTSLINTYHLYKTELKSEPMEDVINKMRSSIAIRPTAGVANVTGRNVPAMQVSFTYNDPAIAKAVCDDVVGRFQSQNTQETLEAHEQANQFLDDEFQRAKRDLDALDQKLADFRAQNAGRLPEEMQLNAQEMNALANRTGSLNEQANRNNEQRMMLETALRTAKDRLAAIKDVNPAVQVRNERVSELDRTMQNLQLQIENMKDQYTDDFPDLQAARKQLAMLQRQKDDLLKQTPKKPDVALDNSGIARERLEAQGSIDGIEAQLKANAMEAQQIQHEIGMSNAQLGAFQARMQAIPAGEKEYLQLMNDRELAKAHYQDLEMKREKSSMSMDLERRKQGESLEILDAASVPVAPTAPKRPLIIALGPGIGLVLGFVLVAVREVKDTSLKNLKDARLYTQLPILGSVPLLENDLVVQHRKQMMWLGWATATLAGLGIIAVSIAHYYMSRA